MRSAAISRGVVVSALLAWVVGCSRPAPPTPELIILHTARLRGNVYPTDVRGEIPLQHYPYLAGYVKATRAEAARHGAEVVVVDLGDSLAGSFAAHVTGSRNMAAFFNTVGYDALVLGNLDADLPADLLPQLQAPVLSPFTGPAGEPAMAGTQPGVRFRKGGLAIALLANFHGDTPVAQHPLRFPSRFGPDRRPVVPVREYGPVLRSLPAIDGVPFTAMAWMKFERPDPPPERFLGSLRALGIDLILGHRIGNGRDPESWQGVAPPDWDPPVTENFLRNNLGFTVARTDLRREGGSWKVLRREVIPLTANTAPPDEEVRAAVAPFAAAIREADLAVGTLDRDLDAAAIHRIYLAALSSMPDIELIASPSDSIRSGWKAGPLRAGQVFNSLPWTAPLYRVSVPASRVAELARLENLDLWRNRESSDPVLHLATSAYFASLVREQFGLVEIEPLPLPGEFDFFLGYLRARPDFAEAIPGPGWVRAEP